MSDANAMKERLKRLQAHLDQENAILADAVASFRELDSVARKIGIFGPEDSFATAVSWWPVIAILGTFSSGKSSFINHVLQQKVQSTGNQAVDDKFTVLCFGTSEQPRVLPGLALDSDPRLPFYRISKDIESVAAGEGRRLDSYMQLTTCNSEALRGRILIDSPGFDADAQRSSTLHIVGQIIDLSDLVLVFFDARHPEPGAMSDTLEHLVSETYQRPDANKFLYILNQIDATAQEDNPEEVFGAWQRALAQKGLTAGRFYRIYNPDVAIPIADDARRERFESKRDEDMAAIRQRMEQVEVERAYRIVGALEKTAKHIRDAVVPAVAEAKSIWRRRTLWTDAAAYLLLLGAPLIWAYSRGHLEVFEGLSETPIALALVAFGGFLLVYGIHRLSRAVTARTVRMTIRRRHEGEMRDSVLRAFDSNTRWWRSALNPHPAGWSGRARKKIARVLADADRLVQQLNDKFTHPAGLGEPAERPRPEADAAVEPEGPEEAPADDEHDGAPTRP